MDCEKAFSGSVLSVSSPSRSAACSSASAYA